MKICLESTPTIVMMDINGTKVPARLWAGHNQAGVPCAAFIASIAVRGVDDQSQFQAELLEQRDPSPSLPFSFTI